MMQQIAAMPTVIAPSTVPEEATVETAKRTEFSSMLRESGRDRLDNASARSDSQARNLNDRTRDSQQITETKISRPSKPSQAEQQDVIQTNRSTASDADSLNSSNESTDPQKISLVQQQSSTNETQDTSSSEVFNYVDFVNEMRGFDTQYSALNAGIAEDLTVQESSNTDIQTDLETFEALTSESLNVTLSKEDMELLLSASKQSMDAQNNSHTQGGDSAVLLDQAITKIARQISVDESNAQSDISILQQDEALLNALLTGNGLKQGANTDSENDNTQRQPGQLTQLLSTMQRQQNPETVNTDISSTEDGIDQSFTVSQLTLQTAVDGVLTQDANIIDVEDMSTVTLREGAELAIESSLREPSKSLSELTSANAETSLTLSIPTSQEPGKQALEQLGLLTQTGELKSLENLTQRISQVIGQVAPDTAKGNEFIVALQAGVKEYNAQLAQGHEPGFDLKDLVKQVSDKLDLTISSAQHAKIEQSVQQFSNTLNLAFNLQQPQHQHFSLTPAETMIAEKLTSVSVDGTKLAQPNPTTSNFDKAINIFKPDGQQQLAERVKWMINGRNSAAEVRLDPPELGAMQIRITMSGDAAAVSFVVQSQQAKEALDMATPRLKEMFNEQGIELGQSSVNQESGDGKQQEQLAGQQDSSMRGNINEVNVSDPMDPVIHVVTQRVAGNVLGGIDFYA